ncbi:MAG: extracellular solute-binding protein [Anaerolineaceae bacterium]|nr:extracellular solute-binding protein [Anaerolineaceae bacterium]
MLKRLFLITSLIMVASMLLAACATPAPATQAPTTPPQLIEVTKIVEGETIIQVITATPAATEVPKKIAPVTVWTNYNQNNPATSIDRWILDVAIDIQRSEGIQLTNVYVPWTMINEKINLAVQSGGEVFDLTKMDMPLDPFYNNEVFMDITDYVKSSEWYKDIDPVYMSLCTGPDGKIYCVPAMSTGSMIYYWTAAYPNGFPKDTDELLAAAAKLKEEGKYALTFKGSENVGVDLFYFQLIHSIGGKYTDENGNTAWATPESVQVIEFLRELFANKYSPDVALGLDFDCETSFKDGTAGAWVAGSWSYVFLNPLTDGVTNFDFGSLSVEEAMRAGALKIADPLTMPGGKPTINLAGANGWAIPVNSKNVEGAMAVIDFLMQPGNNADYAFAFGAVPTNSKSMQDPRFVDSKYWQAAAESFRQTGIIAKTNNNPKMRQAMNDAIITLILEPELDIMTTLQKVQDDLNAGN